MIAWNDGSMFREAKVPDDFVPPYNEGPGVPEKLQKPVFNMEQAKAFLAELKRDQPVQSEDYSLYDIQGEDEPAHPDDIDSANDILLFRTHIAGTTHLDHIDEAEKLLCRGDQLQLSLDEHNPYDEYAVKVCHVSGFVLGFLPREQNEIPARLLAAEKLIFARIEKKRYIRSWLKISISVYLRDPS